ncbi:MAG: hypothetical protein U1E51_23305 [Candidatus Binatia bacterium]|nr:hypothetical protein [Candidatus Binatia bacterium]
MPEQSLYFNIYNAIRPICSPGLQTFTIRRILDEEAEACAEIAFRAWEELSHKSSPEISGYVVAKRIAELIRARISARS